MKVYGMQVKKGKNAVPRPLPAKVVTLIRSKFVVQDSPKVCAKFQTLNRKTLKIIDTLKEFQFSSIYSQV
jgi:hypothetical protein